ncbi:hypothetical protein [Metapseudomonas resinovorans]|uniref:Uncharacterized protein n=1 Tax=Metapseudomonas resinovorans NBRC 106553 TaxID=1245471 RepID=S6ANZ4_METRE|nr:hypothetical protein [Pseudomonas resinovorans]BAN50785.1 hypothetical protein PCA10_50530 [Pseudomonas resinovorans NBRC 106553]
MTDSSWLFDSETGMGEPLLSDDADPFPFQSELSGNDRRESSATPWIEYVAGQWVVLKQRRDVPNERRSYHAMRMHVDKLLEKGWSITGRDPVRLELHQRVKIVRGGVLVDG